MDIHATLLAAFGWSLSAVSLVDPRPGGIFFRVAGVVVGMVTVFPALLMTFLDQNEGTVRVCVLLTLGAVLLASLGMAHAGSAEPWQIAFGYLVPSASLAAAVAVHLLPAVGFRLGALGRPEGQTAEWRQAGGQDVA